MNEAPKRKAITYLSSPQFSHSDFEDKRIEFTGLKGSQSTSFSGLGILKTYPHRDRKRFGLEIQIREGTIKGMNVTRLSLTQEIFDKIQKHADARVADFSINLG